MTYIILFEDDPKANPDIRQNYMSRHLEFLELHSHNIQAAGPLLNGQGRDGLWIVHVDSVEEAESLVKNDPFWPTGLRKSYSIIQWKQVFRDGERLIQPG